MRCNCFDAVCMGSPAIIRLYSYIVYFNHFNNHIGVAIQRAGGCSPSPHKNRDTLIEQSVRIIVKFMKQIRTVRHSFNTTGTVNYRIQLAVPPLTTNDYSNHNHNDTVLKKLTNKYTKKLGIFVIF